MFLEMLGSSGQKPRKAKNSKKIKKGPDEPSISRNMLISEFRKYILVVMNLFTKYVRIYPVANKDSTTTAVTLCYYNIYNIYYLVVYLVYTLIGFHCS